MLLGQQLLAFIRDDRITSHQRRSDSKKKCFAIEARYRYLGILTPLLTWDNTSNRKESRHKRKESLTECSGNTDKTGFP